MALNALGGLFTEVISLSIIAINTSWYGSEKYVALYQKHCEELSFIDYVF